ncbi:MAG TPA: formate/nitrite transporter family protein [Bacilli bacterium]|nr:MAG: putative formate transporter 1 [Tenericutes bacterium ADurb.BinA124]HNZ50408.1 formate/nitrite transporter family protein [Bacilli bacterium]HPN60945.1 formate/nitrite transporter family protein [Bacilli bacterium]HPX83846.1 formate/nitrite transporter family protein [Bacilli bacterium]HQC74628.1 formate/nitrite transporter family protein [Bacilli bacterium]
MEINNHLLYSPEEVVEEAIKVGENKVRKPLGKLLISAILAGFFIGLGYYGYLVLAGSSTSELHFLGKVIGSFVFPIGLVIIILAGGDLFTGNCLITFGWLGKKYRFLAVLKNWGIVYVGNFIGALLLVSLLFSAQVISGTVEMFVLNLAITKVGLSFLEALARGILGNILVSLAVYLTFAAKTLGGKIAGAILPVGLFVLSGYEHSVANMFLLPYAKMLGSQITIGQMLMNLLPVTIGNIIGGAVFVPFAYFFVHK